MLPGGSAKRDERSLEQQFADGLRAICARCRRETGYNASALLSMIDRDGGLEAARQALTPEGLSFGFETICELGRPDLTVEAFVLSSEAWFDRFSERELALARERVALGEARKWRRRITER